MSFSSLAYSTGFLAAAPAFGRQMQYKTLHAKTTKTMNKEHFKEELKNEAKIQAKNIAIQVLTRLVSVVIAILIKSIGKR